ncbi:MAG: 30S ribosomal protein S8 [Chloroflexi bacterium]|nr:30S ribosomal protein S8 [Chloroflexota bacterium]
MQQTQAPPPEQDERVRAAKAPSKRPKPRPGSAVNDPVADMLTRVRNGARARHEQVAMPTSRLRGEIARILKDEGFIGGYAVETPKDEVNPMPQLVLKLKYVGGKVPALAGIKRISKPGLRVHARKTEMPRVLGGLGIAIVSTSSGLMTGREAERKGLGGEVLAFVW